MNSKQKRAIDIYEHILSFKAQGDNLAEIESSENQVRKNRIACIRIELMNERNMMKKAIQKDILEYLTNYYGVVNPIIERGIKTTIMNAGMEFDDEE